MEELYPDVRRTVMSENVLSEPGKRTFLLRMYRCWHRCLESASQRQAGISVEVACPDNCYCDRAHA